MSLRAKRLFGLYSSLSRAFLPKTVYGADWDGETMRIVALENQSGLKVAETFSGNLEQAAVFAHNHGLAFEGLHLSFNEPFVQFTRLGLWDEGGEDLEAKAEKSLPLGLRLEQVEQRIFQDGESAFSATLRADSLTSLNAEMPVELRAFWTASPGPLALLPYHSRDGLPACYMALWPRRTETHALFFREGQLFALERLALGLDDVTAHPEKVLQELRRARYWWEALHPDHPLAAIQIWRDVNGGLAKIADGLGIPVMTSVFTQLPPDLLPEYRLAGAMALCAHRNIAPLGDFGPINVKNPKARISALSASGKLAGIGALVSLIAGAVLLFSALLTFSFSAYVKSEENRFSGALGKWETMKKTRAEVEQRLQGLGGLAVQGNEPAFAMGSLASHLPEELWLQSWEMRGGENGHFEHVLIGLTLNEAHVPEFIARLESGKSGRRFSKVRLRSTEKIAGQKVEEKTGLRANHRDLVRFEVVAEDIR